MFFSSHISFKLFWCLLNNFGYKIVNIVNSKYVSSTIFSMECPWLSEGWTSRICPYAETLTRAELCTLIRGMVPGSKPGANQKPTPGKLSSPHASTIGLWKLQPQRPPALGIPSRPLLRKSQVLCVVLGLVSVDYPCELLKFSFGTLWILFWDSESYLIPVENVGSFVCFDRQWTWLGHMFWPVFSGLCFPW